MSASVHLSARPIQLQLPAGLWAPASSARLARFVRLSVFAVLTTILSLVVASRPSPYALVVPGSVLELGPHIRVPLERRHDAGWLALTTVRSGRATYAAWLGAQFDPAAKLLPVAETQPPGVSAAEYRALLARWTESSKAAAATVALRRAGYPVAVGGQGVLIDGIAPGSAVGGLLRPGDVILNVDGLPTPDVAELAERIRQHSVEEEIAADVLRNGTRLQLSLPPRLPAVGTGWALADLQGWEYVFDVDLPFPIEMASGDVLGDSGGLMLSLSLLDALTLGDLAGGHRVAGSGTIGVDGRVGPIGGVAAKLRAAEQQGADVFLTPRENAEEASRSARRARVIPVGSFEEALLALHELGGGLRP